LQSSNLSNETGPLCLDRTLTIAFKEFLLNDSGNLIQRRQVLDVSDAQFGYTNEIRKYVK